MTLPATPGSPSVRPRIAIALGDPSGIGPEVMLKALNDEQLLTTCEITVVGSALLLRRTYETLSQRLDPSTLVHPDRLNVLEVATGGALDQLQWGVGNAASGEMSFRYLEEAIALALSGEVQAVVTAPIAKSAWKAAGHPYPGQTELLAEKAGVNRFGMMFVARSPHTGWMLRSLLATTHIPLRRVPDALSPDLMTLKLDVLMASLKTDFGLERPRIAIAGLNPHSGEQGQLGTEEQDWLIPWLQTMGDRYPEAQLDGPFPPDTMWIRPGQAWFGSGGSAGIPVAHDAYLALYHDQGLIPVKLMAFDRAVNTTLGLPFIRTSPDHGTAFDIAGRGVADATSFKAAIDLAIELAHQRTRRALSLSASGASPLSP